MERTVYRVLEKADELVATENVTTDPWAMELIRALREVGIEPGSSLKVDAIADRSVVEGTEDIANALRCDMEDMILGQTWQYTISDDSENEGRVDCTRTLENRQILRLAEEVAGEVRERMSSRDLRQV